MAKSNSSSEFSFISEIIIEEWLRRDLSISRSKIKNFILKKNWLKNALIKGNTPVSLDLLNAHLINPMFTEIR